jgi:hypothetical protein
MALNQWEGSRYRDIEGERGAFIGVVYGMLHLISWIFLYPRYQERKKRKKERKERKKGEEVDRIKMEKERYSMRDKKSSPSDCFNLVKILPLFRILAFCSLKLREQKWMIL